MEYSAKQILSCVGSHLEVKVGDIIMLQQVVAHLDIGSQQARKLLSELEQRGFLLYEEGNGGKISAWHFTKHGVDELSK
ncbi:MAG: hypothetical protein D8H91_00830 [Alloprevotella sp.]|nr:MAG: hypothetical protein D8H91_00830 [Alloprevotella sp.]